MDPVGAISSSQVDLSPTPSPPTGTAPGPVSPRQPAGDARNRLRRVLIVITEDHYWQTADGVFTKFGLNYDYWTQYFPVFDEVRPLARVAPVEHADASWRRSSGPNVNFAQIPFYQGLGSLARTLPHVMRAIRKQLAIDEWYPIGAPRRPGRNPINPPVQYYYTMRGSGPLCTMAWSYLNRRGIPYGRQIVGHDREGVHMGTNIRPAFLRDWMARGIFALSRKMVWNACAVAYVSPYLQHEYPTRTGTPIYFFSDVNLDAQLITAARSAESFSADPLRIISVGRMNPEKGYDVLLTALKNLDDAGERRWTLDVIGPGPELDKLKAQAADLGIADRANFAGWVTLGPELYARLDKGDLYIQPSLTEGTPRALLEAMARGLPALGSNVGGIPALVSENALVPPGNPGALADAIRRLIGQRAELAARSRDCFEKAMRFHPDIMQARKREYWTFIRDHTDRWRAERARPAHPVG